MRYPVAPRKQLPTATTGSDFEAGLPRFLPDGHCLDRHLFSRSVQAPECFGIHILLFLSAPECTGTEEVITLQK